MTVGGGGLVGEWRGRKKPVTSNPICLSGLQWYDGTGDGGTFGGVWLLARSSFSPFLQGVRSAGHFIRLQP